MTCQLIDVRSAVTSAEEALQGGLQLADAVGAGDVFLRGQFLRGQARAKACQFLPLQCHGWFQLRREVPLDLVVLSQQRRGFPVLMKEHVEQVSPVGGAVRDHPVVCQRQVAWAIP